MSDHDAELARLRAEMDQGREGMREFAGTVHVFFDALVQAGFSEEHALHLTTAWMMQLIQTAPLSGMANDAGEMLRQLFGDEEQG